MVRPPSVFLDPDRVPPAVENRFVSRLEGFHFTHRQARFAAEAMYLGGVFLLSQTDAWLRHHWPQYAALTDSAERHSYCVRFLQPLFAPVGKLKPIASSFYLSSSTTKYAHCNSRYFYGVVGTPHSRYQKLDRNRLALTRLLNFDYVVRHPEYTWYGATAQKVALFESFGVPKKVWPVRYYKAREGSSAPPSAAYFPDHNPIGISGWSLVFVVPVIYRLTPGNLRRMIDTYYGGFWRQLRRRGFRVTLVFCQQPAPSRPFQILRVLPPTPGGAHRISSNAFRALPIRARRQLKDSRTSTPGGLASESARPPRAQARASPIPRLGLMNSRPLVSRPRREALSAT